MQTLRFRNQSLLVPDEQMVKTLSEATRAARSEAPVFLCGESGTGKELIARYVHEKSRRHRGPFVSVNCAAIPEGLLEAELFGFERGAFTGAVSQRIGKFEKANNGTLLLDEITEMPIQLQAKLLRVLQEGEVDRLGSHSPIRVNPRIIATTNKDPLRLIGEKQFRSDLYYRLNVARIQCEPLRGRKKAISNLTRAFLRQASELHGVEELGISEAAMERLVQYHWPGNVRELQNVIERTVLLAERSILQPDDFSDLAPSIAKEFSTEQSLDEVERVHILRVLQSHSGNRTRAAKVLGISVRTLRYKLKEYRAVSGE